MIAKYVLGKYLFVTGTFPLERISIKVSLVLFNHEYVTGIGYHDAKVSHLTFDGTRYERIILIKSDLKCLIIN